MFATILEGPSTQYLRFLVPKTILFMVSGTRDLKYWVLGPSEYLFRPVEYDVVLCWEGPAPVKV